jgi:hypothetical protein
VADNPDEFLMAAGQVVAMSAKQPANAPSQSRKITFKLILIDDIAVKTEGRYLVKGVLPSEGLVLLWGAPKTGKSFWATDIALHIAAGFKYRGRRTRQGSVVYIFAEGASGIGARREAWLRHYIPTTLSDPAKLPFYALPARVDLIHQYAVLIEDIRSQMPEPPALVVIDTLNRTLVGSESNDEDMAAYIRAADAIREAFNCCTLVVHHSGIDANRYRGHSSLGGAVDAQIAIKRDRDENIVSAKTEQMKEGPEDFESNSKLEVIEVDIDEDGDPITSCVVIPTEETLSQDHKVPRLSAANENALQALRDALNEAGEDAPASNHIPLSTRVVPIELWRKYAYARNGEANAAAKRQAFKRANETLLAKGFIGCWDSLVWVVNR